MDLIEEKLKGPLKALRNTALFDYTLLSMTALLASALVLVLVKAEIYYALAPAAAVTFAYYLRMRGRDSIRSVEKGNFALKERLRAAYDNRDRANIVVKDLIKDVAYELDSVNAGEFLDRRRTNAYVTASIIIVFILLSLLFFGFEGFDVGGLLGGGGGGVQGQGSGGGGGGGGGGSSGSAMSSQDQSVGQGSSQNIYGDASIARIEGQELELEIHPEYGETEGFDSGKEGGEGGSTPGFAQATASETYSESIPVELEGSVRKYFEKLAED